MKPATRLLVTGAMLGAAFFAHAEDRDSAKTGPGYEAQGKDSISSDPGTSGYTRGDEMKERGTSGRGTGSDDTTRPRDKDDVVRDLKGIHDRDDVTRSR